MYLLMIRKSFSPFSISPTSILLNVLLAPGFYLALIVSDGQGGPVFFVVAWVVTTALITSIVYGLLSLIIRVVGNRQKTKMNA